jgi:Cdc6-like AAA superfamily ATPase
MNQIIVNQECLLDSYLPEKLLYRDREKTQLLSNLKNSVSTLVYGPFGSGKSCLVKNILKSINGKVFACYVDCSVYQTTYSILKEIVPRAQLIFCRSNYELLKELMKEIKQRKFVVCFDNFERLKDKDLIKKFLSLGITLVLITDSEENLSLLTEDVKFKLSIIKFQAYTTEQSFEILKDRAEKALAKWSYSDSILKKIADKINGNIALGINLLKQAAISAEARGKKVIEESDIPKVEEDCPFKLNRDEKVLLKILHEWKSLPASRLYEFYVQSIRHPKGERSFRNYMGSLCSKGLVKAIGEKRGRIYEVVEDAKSNC